MPECGMLNQLQPADGSAGGSYSKRVLSRRPSSVRKHLAGPGFCFSISALQLVGIHVLVGQRNQRLRVHTVVREGGTSNADADPNFMVVNKELISIHAPLYPPDVILRLQAAGARQDRNKLIAGVTHTSVGSAHLIPQSMGYLNQQTIPHLVTIRIIYGFEALQIHHQNRYWVIQSFGTPEFVLQEYVKVARVR